MRIIDLETWPRRKHLQFFAGLDYPHFNLTAPLEMTALKNFVKQTGGSPTLALSYLVARTANDLPEFRQRIRSGPQVVEHERVHPSLTVMDEQELFSFCLLPYTPDYPAFAHEAARRIQAAQQHPSLEDEPGKDDLLFLSAIPWVAFTGLTHPIHLHPVDSIPRITWGRFFEEGGRWKVPVSVQGHHGLVDGLHLGRFFQRLQAYLDTPEHALT